MNVIEKKLFLDVDEKGRPVFPDLSVILMMKNRFLSTDMEG